MGQRWPWRYTQHSLEVGRVGNKAAHLYPTRRQGAHPARRFAERQDAPGYFDKRRANTGANVDGLAGNHLAISQHGLRQRFHNVANPDEINELIATIKQQFFSTSGAIKPERDNPLAVAWAIDICQTKNYGFQCAARLGDTKVHLS